MKSVIKLVGLFLLIHTSQVLAEPATVKSVTNCERKFSDVKALSRCLDQVKESVDRILQTWINNQIFVLEEFALKTGRKASLEMFKRSQRNFITYRENNCRWQYLHISPDINAAAAYKKCYINVTQNRINELSDINQ
ncbi:lysozyme inhibitor LprI family protein [Thalassotalea ganghwensis]